MAHPFLPIHPLFFYVVLFAFSYEEKKLSKPKQNKNKKNPTKTNQTNKKNQNPKKTNKNPMYKILVLASFVGLNLASLHTSLILLLLFLTSKIYFSVLIRLFYPFCIWFFFGHNAVKEAGPAWLSTGSTQHFTRSYPAME